MPVLTFTTLASIYLYVVIWANLVAGQAAQAGLDVWLSGQPAATARSVAVATLSQDGLSVSDPVIVLQRGIADRITVAFLLPGRSGLPPVRIRQTRAGVPATAGAQLPSGWRWSPQC
ncbi:protein of unknown function [Candidatus Hydrogenisulfobacillus filiaventi]|uniref:Uncharacterized protein n=1 Tax=Candidatus Hydrogenisulfobacillus filiaventi TaxID=2707344 RepID=A0A6F8ZEW2_9FIRM|nr:hypothetical protein [Bacillota bacterium]CAB1128536.1 protein of unknown function [Candidatus Hydrogenisulfobacillus filiaventi]